MAVIGEEGGNAPAALLVMIAVVFFLVSLGWLFFDLAEQESSKRKQNDETLYEQRVD